MALVALAVYWERLPFTGPRHEPEKVEPLKPSPEPPPVPAITTGKLRVNVDPVDTAVKVLNIKAKYYDGIELEEGRYHIEASCAGYETIRLWLELEAGQDKVVNIRLDRSRPKTGRLYVETMPQDSTVKLLGTKEQFEQNMELPPGRYHLAITAPGHEPVDKWVTIGEGSDKNVTVSLAPIIVRFSEDDVSTNSVGMKFVYIKPGTFAMGSPEDEPGRDAAEQQHTVTLSKGFYMQTTEVTQAQWVKLMAGNPSYFNGCDDCPVEVISWEDAQKFILALNYREGTSKYRLPTEAEWEYACRAGSSTALANGSLNSSQCEHDPNMDAVGWYCGNSGKTTHPVGRKAPNAWGLHDMHGNVWEWCQGWRDDYSAGKAVDPEGPPGELLRVIRGGSWGNYAEGCRSASRSGLTPGYSINRVGFRVTRTP